jgi:hypothetical protein
MTWPVIGISKPVWPSRADALGLQLVEEFNRLQGRRHALRDIKAIDHIDRMAEAAQTMAQGAGVGGDAGAAGYGEVEAIQTDPGLPPVARPPSTPRGQDEGDWPDSAPASSRRT